MRTSQMLIPTLRDDPGEAETVSHRLMLRAGMIRKTAAGVYTYLPLGLRVIRKVEQIVREEMNRAGAQELLMPIASPAELWRETGRWDFYGKELFRFKDRHERDFCLGPTHEEVITDLIRKEVRSYRQLPLNCYQIQTKFRDEIRPRFGLMRGREFIMKDAYSFDKDEEGAKLSYQKMYDAYHRIFTRCGLTFRAVEADTGLIGGSSSHEFMVLADTGEETIVYSDEGAYAANVERAEVSAPGEASSEPVRPMRKVPTPGARTVEEVCALLKVSPQQLVKTLLYKTALRNVVVGGNEADAHYLDANAGRDFTVDQVADLRNALAGDLSPRGGGRLKVAKGIEVGHVFMLGTKYSKAMGSTFLDPQGQECLAVMGCYGIGVSRAAAAAIEQNHDAKGIIWPIPIAPFHVHLLPLSQSAAVQDQAKSLYAALEAAGVEVLWDDRDERAGVKFNDADLIGAPLHLVIGEKGLAQGQVELKNRRTGAVTKLPPAEIVAHISSLLQAGRQPAA
jgi:prolyl-tRNA synthetase